MDPDEGRNSEIAREMRETGSWLIPRYNGFDYLDKPAPFFRLVALSFSAFGESEFAARLPSVLFGLLTLGLLAAFCRHVYGPREGALAVLVAGTAPLVFIFARLVIFDMMLAFFVCAAIFAGYLAEEREGRARRGWLVAGAASAAFATLVKGPVGFIVPTLVLASFHLLERRPRAIARLLHPLNLLVFFAIVLPWFLALVHERPDFAHYGLVEESLRRFTTDRFDRSKPFWYYPPLLLVGTGAWAILVPRAAIRAWRGRAALSRPTRLFIAWVLATLVFFSLSSSKLPHYILTTVIALSALLARILAQALAAPEGKRAAGVRSGVKAIGIICLGTAVVLLAFVLWRGPLMSLFHIRGRNFERMEASMAPGALAFALIGIVALAGRYSKRLPVTIAAYAAAPLLFTTIAFDGLLQFSDSASSRALARRIEEIAPRSPFACLGCYPCGAAFYLRRCPTVFTEDGHELTSNYLRFELEKGGTWPASIVPLADCEAWLAAAREPLLLLAQRTTLASLDSIAKARRAKVVELVPGWWGVLLEGRGSD